MNDQNIYIKNFDGISINDIHIVGGKNASLGEMIKNLSRFGINIPDGFATTTALYKNFLSENGLNDLISSNILAYRKHKITLQVAGRTIRDKIKQAKLSDWQRKCIGDAYKNLSQKENIDEVTVAVRSSATAEDLPDTSFAGQQESFLNVRGEKRLCDSIIACFASLFTDRAIYYREQNGFDHDKVLLSVGIQKMIRADKASSGVMFTIDTDTGYPDIIIINAAWGLGESIVGGLTDPDEYRIYKPFLDDNKLTPIIEKKCGEKTIKTIYRTTNNEGTEHINCSQQEKEQFVLQEAEILELAKWAKLIEQHYQRPMDIEWAKDGESNQLFCVQARPETVQSRRVKTEFESYKIKNAPHPILSGVAIGQSIVSARARLIKHPEEMSQLNPGDILITEKTDPDWVPIMKKASAIVTDHGGRTSHAAIVSRELGIPAIVGTGIGTSSIKNDQMITASCAEGEKGNIYDGKIAFEKINIPIDSLPVSSVDLMINLADPMSAFRWWKLPIKGVGLARMEFIINNAIKIHPLALSRYELITDLKLKSKIDGITATYKDKKSFFIETLGRGIASIAASQFPSPCIVRLSDFKSNEYAKLIGGDQYESYEENPMLGFRGASRYYDKQYADAFVLECQSISYARNNLGFKNIIIMIPFVRTLSEADKVLHLLELNNLRRGESGLKIYMMCEIPANALLAEEFAERFDGFSIGSNDLTQLTLGVDRDSERLKRLFDENNEAVTKSIAMIIQGAHKKGIKVGICGQAPSDYPEFARLLVDMGIDSISLNPDSVINVINLLGAEKKTKSIA